MSARRRNPGTDQLSWHIRLLLGGYPPWWRLRYDDEMRDTLLALRAGGTMQALSGIDLARGLVDAWLHPTTTSPEAHMTAQTTRLLGRTAWGLLLLALAGCAFAKVVEDPAFTAAAEAHPALALSIDTVRAAALACLVIITVAAVVTSGAVIRLPASDRRHCLLLLAVVPACTLSWLVALAAARLVTDSTAIHSARHVAAFAIVAAATVVAGVCCTAALLQVAARLPQDGAVPRLRSAALVVTGPLVALIALSVMVWTVLVATQSPHLLRADNGLLATPTVVSALAVVVALVAAAVLCGRSAVTVFSSRADAPRNTR